MANKPDDTSGERTWMKHAKEKDWSLAVLVAKRFPWLPKMVSGGAGRHLDGISVRKTEEGAWLCVFKYFDDELWEMRVAFGRGGNPWEAVVAACTIVNANGAVKDKPFKRA